MAKGGPEELYPDTKKEATNKVLTFNAWNALTPYFDGLKLKGLQEEEERQWRYKKQIELFREADLDVVFLQELNPYYKQIKNYRYHLGYHGDAVGSSCGVGIFGKSIPTNLYDGLGMLVRPSLRFKKLTKLRLKGRGWCNRGAAFQSKEIIRSAMVGEIEHPTWGKTLLVAVHLTHVSGYTKEVEKVLVEGQKIGAFTEEEISQLSKELRKNTEQRKKELNKIFNYIDERTKKITYDSFMIGGDFNFHPSSYLHKYLEDKGYVNLSKKNSSKQETFSTWSLDNSNTGLKNQFYVKDKVSLVGKKYTAQQLSLRSWLNNHMLYQKATQLDYVFTKGKATNTFTKAKLFGTEPYKYKGKPTHISDHFGLLVQ